MAAAAPPSKSLKALTPEDRYWMPDSASDQCLVCSEGFGWFGSKHHCRLCGFIVCSTCSDFQKEMGGQAERVCKPCFEGKTPEGSGKEYNVTLNFKGMLSKVGCVYWVAFDYRAADNFPPKNLLGAMNSGKIDMKDVKTHEGVGEDEATTYSVSVKTKLPQTVLAISGFHSPHGLNTIRTGMLGIPTDGIFVSKDGFSNFGAPRFKDCCLVIAKDTTLDMNIKYYLSAGSEELQCVEVLVASNTPTLGFTYDSLNQGQGLVVKTVEASGAIATWNKEQKEEAKQVKAEDYLISLNDQSTQESDTAKVIEELTARLKEASSKKPCKLVFARLVPVQPKE
eukprot:gb/GEZN01006756.1/.p1 GENE.gb/GEZN01006756.1/~~gb/GEZN01006756.1/.p1  ORF type:complete len:346 (+),score=66.89 gb/GEZN01006756.1/:26-1039(+)